MARSHVIGVDLATKRVVMLRCSAIDGGPVRQVDVMTQREARKAARDLLRAADGLAGRYPAPPVTQAAEPAQVPFDMDFDLDQSAPVFATTGKS